LVFGVLALGFLEFFELGETNQGFEGRKKLSEARPGRKIMRCDQVLFKNTGVYHLENLVNKIKLNKHLILWSRKTF
jgi:hypothetical protein